jgi:hypothetical protein
MQRLALGLGMARIFEGFHQKCRLAAVKHSDVYPARSEWYPVQHMDPKAAQALLEIAQAQQHWLPQWLIDVAQLALLIVTAWTLYYLRLYTAETVQLRKATRDQVEVGNQVLSATREQVTVGNRLLAEAQVQNSNAIRPILNIWPHNRTSAVEINGKSYSYSFHTIRNMGNGPAFDIKSDAFHSNGISVTLVFKPVLAKDAEEPFGVWIHQESGDRSIGSFEGLLVARFQYGVSFPPTITLRYNDAAGKQYYSTHNVVTTGDIIGVFLRDSGPVPLDAQS